MVLKLEELERLKESVRESTEKRKEIRSREKYAPTKKQKKMENLSDKQVKELEKLQKQLGGMVHKNVFIKPARKKGDSDEDIPSKRDLKKGKNNNEGVHGIHSENYLKDVLKVSDQLVKYCYQEHGIKQLRDIKPRMIEEFCRGKMEDGDWSYRTLGTRIGQIKKIGESASKQGLKKYSKLVTSHTEALRTEFRPEKIKENRTRGKKADGSGLSLREARVISKKVGEKYGPMGEVMINILTEGGLRADELMHLKWEHIDFETNTISLTEKNMTKGGRPRILEDVSPKTMEKLKDIYDSGLFPNPRQTIFRSHFHSEKVVREVISEGAKAGHVANLGIHAFRNSTKEYQKKKFEKELKQMEKKYGKKQGKEKFKQAMAEKMLRYVGADPKLNPIINEKTGETVHTVEKIMKRRTDRIINDVITQSFGHNRRDVLGQY